MGNIEDLVTSELEKRGWALVSAHHEFGIQVRRELAQRHADADAVPEEQVRRAAVRCYARVLFAACGDNGTPRQQQAFREIQKYLFPRAMFQLHDRIRAEDAVQRTLIRIYERQATCRDGGSFIRWCDQILQRLVIDDRRAQTAEQEIQAEIEYRAREVRFYAPGETVNEDSKEQEDAVADPSQDTPHAAMTEAMHNAIVNTMRDCLGDDRQVKVLGQMFFNDKTFLEIANLLHTSPENVQVIRHRAIQKLKNCDEMQQLVEDWNYQ